MNPRLDPDLLRTFVAIVDQGSFRAAAERVGRTQSAVSMQVQRLEEAVGHALFLRERPVARLTAKGEALLGYAHRLLTLQDEAISALSGHAAGSASFGAPDDYAMGLLPQILTRFAADYPRVELELRCEPSPRLVELMAAGDLDVAVITRGPGRPAGQFLKAEPLVWAGSPRRPCHERDVLPLAVFQPDCMTRRFAADALSAAGRAYRIAYSSPHLAALLAVVDAGLAVAALPESSVPAGLQVLGGREGFPPLPALELGLLRNPASASPAVDALAECALAAARSPRAAAA